MKLISLKTTGWISALVFTAVMVASCEKVIDIDLETAASQLVIEGVITDQNGTQSITISKSVAFTESNVFPAVQGATVSVSDDAGRVWPFNESKAGTYTTAMKGETGRTYTMHVTVNGTSYTASSTMPALVKLDSLSIKEFTFGGSLSKQVQAHYKDPKGKANYYRFTLKLNGKQSPLTYSENDRFTDGNEVKSVLFREEDDDDKIKPGDNVEVEMQCIDASVFSYWFTFSQQVQNGPGGGATPGNPPSNISNNVLGYFSAQTREAMTLKVK